MTVASFDYWSPVGQAELVTALSEAHGDVAVLGGGTMLVPDITHGKASPTSIIDLSRCGLGGVYTDGNDVVVGAMTTYSQLIRERPEPMVVSFLGEVALNVTGGPQIRNRGTVGGSAAYANPNSDVPGCLVALDAVIRLISPDGVREIRAEDFYRGPFKTARRRNEVLLEVLLPQALRQHFGYIKFKLAQSSWPIVTASAVLAEDGGLRIGVGGVAGAPFVLQPGVPVHGVEDVVWRADVRKQVADKVASFGGLWGDVLADGAYRNRITPTVIARAVAVAMRRKEEEKRRHS